MRIGRQYKTRAVGEGNWGVRFPLCRTKAPLFSEVRRSTTKTLCSPACSFQPSKNYYQFPLFTLIYLFFYCLYLTYKYRQQIFKSRCHSHSSTFTQHVSLWSLSHKEFWSSRAASPMATGVIDKLKSHVATLSQIR